MIKIFAFYWHTLRHIKISQIYQRLKFNLINPTPDISKHPDLRSPSGFWVAPIEHSPSLIGSEEFCFFGERGLLGVIGWDDPQKEKLWRYNLHYFDDLNASLASERREWHLTILKKWVDQNPPAQGVGWEPYPISLRVVNWIKWSLNGNVLPPFCVQSLAIQVRFLSKRLEWHLLGNHLLANAKALIFAGFFFQGYEADAWLSKGLQILESELPEQILGDGGHFERSPMYHAIVLEDLLDLINLSSLLAGHINISVILKWKKLAQKMLSWLEVMTHPDGQISFFNDAAFGISSTFQDLLLYAKSLEIKFDFKLAASPLAVYKLDDSGYIQLRSIDAAIYLDVAPVGPDYLPGHAHADTLSFEMSVFSQRVIVNSGTSCYGLGFDRMRERQTRSHSTVEVNGQSSSEVWGGFRVAKRAMPFGLQIKPTEDAIYVSCSHNGYKSLKGRPIHHREWIFTENDLTIADEVHGGEYESIARFVMHPSVSIKQHNISEWHLYLLSGQKLVLQILSGNAFIESATYSPEFGVRIKTQCLAITLVSRLSRVKLRWHQ